MYNDVILSIAKKWGGEKKRTYYRSLSLNITVC